MSTLDVFFDDQGLPPSRNKTSMTRRFVGILAVVAVLITGFFLVRAVTSPSPPTDYVGEGVGSVTVVVERGDSLTTIAQRLAEAGVILSSDAFLETSELKESASRIGPGQYELREEMSASAALELMLDPVSRQSSRMVLPEGLRLDETVSILAESSGVPKKDFEEALGNPAELDLPPWADERPEGFLFPATYELQGGEGATDLLKTLISRFDQSAVNLDLVAQAEAAGRSPYDVLIIASLVEAEVAPDDYAKASAVVYNRLNQDMPLQFDSTVSYALGLDELQLSDDQLSTESPYNTYENRGLPPTPINSPGDAAIKAALNPAKGAWLYFVAVGPNTTETRFAKTYDRFLELKRQFRANLDEAS